MKRKDHDCNSRADSKSYGVGDGVGSHPKPERRGWPFWVALILMLAALTNYILTDDLRGWHIGPLVRPKQVAVGK